MTRPWCPRNFHPRHSKSQRTSPSRSLKEECAKVDPRSKFGYASWDSDMSSILVLVHLQGDHCFYTAVMFSWHHADPQSDTGSTYTPPLPLLASPATPWTCEDWWQGVCTGAQTQSPLTTSLINTVGRRTSSGACSNGPQFLY
ncbi:hypothetical protein G5714_010714 [Onychostoma macrolepis]|uniref:Uncharacterized protein n=1 Tax=Onychostoma macrolepis TaxID=369639 RepID=A0A7J6CN07_9TELE|nr:hypothetical protein G5714_010714 [Onychostoma macrolepis]